MKPPPARRDPTERTVHGDTVTDDFAWLDQPTAPESLAFLESQNTYAEESLAGQTALAEAIYAEITARAKTADLTVPIRKGGWWYYTRTVDGGQYEVHARVAVSLEDPAPPISEDGQPPVGEQLLFDGNELAAGHGHMALGAFAVSPDGNALAYSTDFSGDERFTLHVRDLVTGAPTADEIPGIGYGAAWSADGSALYYVTVNESWRPFRVWRHVLGTPVADDAVLFEEVDERFSVRISATRSERFVVITCASKLTSEVRLVDATRPDAEPRLVAARRPGVKYTVEHQPAADGTDRLLVLHNDGAVNFELAAAPLSSPGDWKPLLPHREDTRLLGVQAFATHFVVSFRREGLTGLAVIRSGDGAIGRDDLDSHEITFDEPFYAVRPGTNPDFSSRVFRLSYESHTTPKSVYDYDTETGALTLLWRRPVLNLPGPDSSAFSQSDYEQHREWAVSPDGTRVPISVVCRRDLPRDASAAFLLVGYGGYEVSLDPVFSVPLLSLLERGCGFAVAHVRGGGELGRHWYEDGKLANKPNSFADFVACAEHLAAAGWTRPDRLIARGASAGGMLVAASANLAPAAFGGVIAQVPFVDVLTTMLDSTRPLTVTEREEWGDPLNDPAAYALLKSYSPYENIKAMQYPPILALASLHDARVPVSEAAKWIARLQAEGTGGPFLLKTAMGSGHGGHSGRYDIWRTEAEILAWVLTTASL